MPASNHKQSPSTPTGGLVGRLVILARSEEELLTRLADAVSREDRSAVFVIAKELVGGRQTSADSRPHSVSLMTDADRGGNSPADPSQSPPTIPNNVP